MNTLKTIKLYTLLLPGLCALWLSGCSGNDPDPLLVATPTQLTAPAAGGDLRLTITANNTWTTTSDASWITVSKTDETTAVVHVAANEDNAARTGYITCMAAGITEKVSVSQPHLNATQKDSLALVALYDATGGSDWSAPQWDLAKPMAQWSGVKIVNGRVAELKLADRQLNGALPDAIGTLSQLEYLDLSRNQLSGVLPSSINQLTELAYLDVMANNFTGGLPSLSALTKLVVLDVSDNNFTSSAASAFVGTLPALEILIMRHVGLTGALPATLPAKLHTLDLSNNKLSGPIPAGWDALTKMEILYLYGNTSLNGEIPAFTYFNALRSLALDGNAFTGNVPANFVHLPLLSELWLTNNQLSGTIDAALLADPRWKNWHVCSGNTFTNCSGDAQAAGAPQKVRAQERPYPSKAKYQRN